MRIGRVRNNRGEITDIELRLYEVPLAQQIRGLVDDLYDAGFTLSPDVGESLVAVPAWSAPIVVAIPPRHPLLVHKRLPLDEVLRYPLVLCDPDACEGCSRQFARMLGAVDREPIVADRVSSHEMMVTLVAAGYGLGFSTAAHVSASNHPEIVTRPLAGRQPMLTTYLVRRIETPSEPLQRFIKRALVQVPPGMPIDILSS